MPLYMYPKAHIVHARFQICSYLDSLLHQCKTVMSLLQYVKSINFDIYNVEYVLLSSYVVGRNDLLIHTMLFDGFILLESFVTPGDFSTGIKLWADFFPIL